MSIKKAELYCKICCRGFKSMYNEDGSICEKKFDRHVNGKFHQMRMGQCKDKINIFETMIKEVEPKEDRVVKAVELKKMRAIIVDIKKDASPEDIKKAYLEEFKLQTNGDIEKYMYCSICSMYLKKSCIDRHKDGKYHTSRDLKKGTKKNTMKKQVLQETGIFIL